MKKFLMLLPFLIYSLSCSVPSDVNITPSGSSSHVRTGSGENSKVVTGSDDSFYQVGIASWYGGKFNGRRTSNGEIYDMFKLTAAHKELPFNTIVEVENLKNRKKVIVRINDRGPFVKNRIIDLSFKAAISIEMDEIGTAPVVLRIVDLINSGRGKRIVVKKIDYYHRSEFYLQAGAFTLIENAESLVVRLNYYSPEVKFRITFENGYHKVISVKISLRDDAERLKRTLEDLGFDTFIKEVFITGEKK